jgi:putative copper export protein
MNLLRFVMLLSLAVWIGGIIFFAFVVAPTVFSVLPTHDLAGRVVNRSLTVLHWMGIVSGIVYLITSMIYARVDVGYLQPFAARHALVMLMVVLSLVSMFAVASKMEVLRADMGIIDNIPQSDSRRIEFNELHRWSTRLEVGVFAMGLAVLYLTGKALSH